MKNNSFPVFAAVSLAFMLSFLLALMPMLAR